MRENAQPAWRAAILAYARDINAFVERGQRHGWAQAGAEPDEPRLETLAEAAISAVRAANATGELRELRDLWPPAHAPLIPVLKAKGQRIPTLCLLDDGSIVARIGGNGSSGRTVRIHGDVVGELPGSGPFGRSPDRRYFGVAGPRGVSITAGWGGPEIGWCPWPTGQEGLPEGRVSEPWDLERGVTSIIPFPDGRRVLLVGSGGIFVLRASGAQRLLPRPSEIQDEECSLFLDMEHAAISSDGQLIVVGSQDSNHLVFDAHLDLVGDIEPASSYPHHVVFSADQRVLACNSCHFYGGSTIAVPIGLLPGLTASAGDARVPEIERSSRVYAAVSRDDEFIIGDASGYIRAFGQAGDPRWQLFLGSSVGAMDLAADGRTLAVSTYAGFIGIYHLDAGAREPHQIGTGGHREVRRWVFWKDEPRPLIW